MSGVTSMKKRHGGRRHGAGRKKSRKLHFDPSHARRPELSYKHGVHVVLRTDWRVPRLRQRRGYEAIRRALLHCLGGDDFRVIHLSIQKNHIHLIVEAAHKDALRRGMQRFAIRAARALNVHFKRAGKVFAFRYLAKQIKSADYARNALSYVLNNWRKHRADHDEKKGDTLFDVFSSARSLAGWTEKYQRELARAKPPPEYEVSLPVSLPRTALLRSQWQWHGLIDPFERPRPLA
jgi:REP element-mobilizing transposase RayT